MRGVWYGGVADRLDDPATLRGFALLEEMGLIASMNVTWEHMARVRSIAERHPELQMVVDHTGSPRGRTREYIADWRRGIATAAGAGNVWCKLSGLGMTDHEWSTDSIRPFIEYCIETFGVERCFFGTNWPVDSLFSSYEAVVAAYAEITAVLSEGDRTALHAGNAERLYRV
ncbi:MAG: amidohydrolase [Chloroflexi bacterium]|nr:amidohydrolase [Chloroflexota bacterium]